MNNVNENVVVVFKDAADYENRVTRQMAFKDVTRSPYVIIVSEEFGKAPDTAVLAPDDVRMKIMEQSPEPFSTWLKTDDGDWVPISPTKADKLYSLYKSAFLDHARKLAYLLQALGVRKFELVSRESSGDSSEDNAKGSSKIGVDTPQVDVDVAATLSKAEKNELKRELSQIFKAEYSDENIPDIEYVSQLMKTYGFEKDMVLLSIRDVHKHGRKLKHFEYHFEEDFTSAIESKIDSALKVSCKVSKLPVNVTVEANYESLKTAHKTTCRTLMISIDN